MSDDEFANPLNRAATHTDMNIALMSLRTVVYSVPLPDDVRITVNYHINALDGLFKIKQIEGVMTHIDALITLLDRASIQPPKIFNIALSLANMKYLATSKPTPK